MEFDNVLYIIGNGFDLHHGVRSSYKDFERWLKKHDTDTYSTYNTVCPYSNKWQDFETSMAYVDRDYLIESGGLFLFDKIIDFNDCQVADILMGGDAATNTADELLDNLKKDLHRWICSISIPKNYEKNKLFIDYYGRFLTFNYSLFLESKYGIERERINYIHGCKTDLWGTLVVGHGEDNENVFNKWWDSKSYDKVRYNKHGRKNYKRDLAYKCYNSNSPEYEHISVAVENYFDDAKKDVSGIIEKNEIYFQSLSFIRHIYIWGFSFSEVDMPYIIKLIEINSYPDQMLWYINYYADEEKQKFKEKMVKLGVDEKRIVFQKLPDFLMQQGR